MHLVYPENSLLSESIIRKVILSRPTMFGEDVTSEELFPKMRQRSYEEVEQYNNLMKKFSEDGRFRLMSPPMLRRSANGSKEESINYQLESGTVSEQATEQVVRQRVSLIYAEEKRDWLDAENARNLDILLRHDGDRMCDARISQVVRVMKRVYGSAFVQESGRIVDEEEEENKVEVKDVLNVPISNVDNALLTPPSTSSLPILSEFHAKKVNETWESVSNRLNEASDLSVNVVRKVKMTLMDYLKELWNTLCTYKPEWFAKVPMASVTSILAHIYSALMTDDVVIFMTNILAIIPYLPDFTKCFVFS